MNMWDWSSALQEPGHIGTRLFQTQAANDIFHVTCANVKCSEGEAERDSKSN